MAHGPREKQIDFGGNVDHDTLGLGLDRVKVGLGNNSNNFATSAALAEVCALLSAVQVLTVESKRNTVQPKNYEIRVIPKTA